MNKWHDLQLQDRLTEILCEFAFDEGHHFGRPYASAYQIAIAFAGRYPALVEQIGLPLGGPGIGKRNSLTQYLAGELSRRIKSGEITHIEGAWLSTLRLHRLEFDLPDDVLNVPAHQVVLSMFRLTEQGLRALDRQRYDEAVAAGLRARRASQGRHRTSPRSGEEINDAEQVDDGSPKQPRLL